MHQEWIKYTPGSENLPLIEVYENYTNSSQWLWIIFFPTIKFRPCFRYKQRNYIVKIAAKECNMYEYEHLSGDFYKSCFSQFGNNREI